MPSLMADTLILDVFINSVQTVIDKMWGLHPRGNRADANCNLTIIRQTWSSFSLLQGKIFENRALASNFQKTVWRHRYCLKGSSYNALNKSMNL